MSTVLDVKDLKQHFKVNRKFTVKAVDGISFTIDEGKRMVLSANPVQERAPQAVR